jgi:flagellar hook-associated protein 2
VAAGIYADRAPERIWQADQTTLTSQTAALTAIQTATAAIQTDMQSLNTLAGPLSARTVASSNRNVVTATAAEGTILGNHTVVVNSLAAAGSWYSSLVSTPTVTLPTSSITITSTSGNPVSFATGMNTTTGIKNPGDTLNDLASAINSYVSPTGAKLGVTATVVSDSTGSRLAIISKTAGTAADFSVAEPYTTWTAPEMSSGESLGANSLTMTSAAGTATIATTSGESYATLATAINNATVVNAPTAYASAVSTLTGSTALTAGSITTIQDNATGNTMTFTAASGDSVADLNNAIAAAVTAGTLSPNVAGSITGGQEVISQGPTDKGITVSTNDSALGVMGAAPGTMMPLGLTATATTDTSGNTFLTITSPTTTPFTINEPSASGSSFQFTQSVAGADALLTVDGVPIDSAGNTVTGAIPGVTLTLLSANPGSQTGLEVGSDASAVATAINQFVSDYNTAIGLVNSQFNLSSSTNAAGITSSTEGVLASDPTVVDLQGTLERAVSYLNAPTTGTTTVSTLHDLGITTNADGTLAIDSTTLNNALTNNSVDVQNFFEGASLNGFASSLNNSLNKFLEPANGAFTVDLRSISATNANLTSEINAFETNYIASQQKILTAMYSAAEIALQQLPQEMQQIQAELGNNSNGKSAG